MGNSLATDRRNAKKQFEQALFKNDFDSLQKISSMEILNDGEMLIMAIKTRSVKSLEYLINNCRIFKNS